MSRLTVLLLLVVASFPAAAATKVVASLYPLAMVASAVAKPDTEVKHLVPGGASPHDYQLTPGDLEVLAGADIIVWAGPVAEPYLAAALERPREGQVIVTLSKLPGVVLRDYRLDPGDAKKRGQDPHLWLSTRNAALLARALGARLGNTPAAEFFEAEMQRWRNRQAKRFAPLADRPLLVAHDAYGYLFDEIGLKNASAVVADPSVAPSPKRVAALAQLVRADGIQCMVGEPGFEQAIAPRLFEGVAANRVVIDPLLPGITLARDSFTLALVHLADTLHGCLVTRPRAAAVARPTR